MDEDHTAELWGNGENMVGEAFMFSSARGTAGLHTKCQYRNAYSLRNITGVLGGYKLLERTGKENKNGKIVLYAKEQQKYTKLCY